MIFEKRLRRIAPSVLNDGRAQESPGQKPDNDRSKHEKTVPVQADKKRKATISVKHNLHGPILP